MQLVAYGAQDIYLTGNPQITFFKVVYRRHTNFAMESIEQTLNGTADFGNRVTATISRNGDLVHRMYWEWKITGFHANDDTCANLGSAILKEIELEIGGQKIDKHYGHWLEAWAELTEENPSGHVGQETVGGVLKNGTSFQNMSSMGGVEGIGDHASDTGVRFTPLQFWFCRNPGLALPLIALQYHEVKVITEFESRVKCVSLNTTTDSAAAKLVPKLYADYIYLDTDERRRFAQVSHEYLIEQLQFNDSSSTKKHLINFNHPVKELIWTGGASTNSHASDSTETGPSSHGAMVANNFKLKLNGHDRFAERPLEYFTRTQVWQHHSGYGGIDTDQGAPGSLSSIAVYSFALKPEEHQPSGTCNFSRIDNAELNLSTTADALYIYAVNYNVLRIMSGMGGLAYSN